MFHNLARLLRYRGLIQSLVARELKARYRGSVLGFLWSFINPLLLLLVYTFVFTVVMPRAHAEIEPYSLFMFCGILPWTWFSSSLIESAGVLISGGNLIKKVLFPAEILPIVSVLANMVHFFLGLPILAGVPDLLPRPRARRAGVVSGRRPRAADLHARFRAVPVGADRALPRHPRLALERADVLVLRHPDHLSVVDQDRESRDRLASDVLKLNPFTHLAISYQEILFFNGPVATRSGCSPLGVVSVAAVLRRLLVLRPAARHVRRGSVTSWL